MPIVQSNNFARPRPVFFMLVLAVLLLFLPRLALADKEVPEYHVKAVFLYNLASFVTWPEDWHRDADTFVIGIYGNDPFGTLIDQTVAGEQRQGKPIEIIRYKDIGELKTPSCDILFISSSITENFSEIRTALRDVPVLTVADTSGFPEYGGMVNLLKKDNRIKVEINLKAAGDAKL